MYIYDTRSFTLQQLPWLTKRGISKISLFVRDNDKVHVVSCASLETRLEDFPYGGHRYFTPPEETENWTIKSAYRSNYCSTALPLPGLIRVLDALSRSSGLTMAPSTATKLLQSTCYGSRRPTVVQVTPLTQ